MLPLPNYIIISGSGKKVGKTFLATALIRHFSAGFSMVALKISPHRHDSLGDAELIRESDGVRIFRDRGPHRKNTGQFLAAGAAVSFFMETDDGHLPEGLTLFSRDCNPSGLPVICESGALGGIVNPGIRIFIAGSNDPGDEHKLAAMRSADLVLPAREFDPGIVAAAISFREGSWKLRERLP